MDETPGNVLLVRCPKCKRFVPEVTDYSVYSCGGCGAVLRGRKFPSSSVASTSSNKSPSSSPSFSNDPPPSAFPESFPYDVFLSFRGIDTRNNFTGHLYDRLVMAGLRTFMDDSELHLGREFPLQLMRAIEDSRIYVVVFSQNYASSRWCLEELVKIIHQCDKNKGRVLLPVFYGVQPYDVRWRKGSFEEAFRNYEASYINQPDLVQTWQDALFRAANYSGFDLLSSALGSESRLISLIVKELLCQVKPKKLFVAKYPVGLDSRVNDVFSLLSLESDYHVRIIGIWGMGGSGKSAIAKSLYNRVLQFFDSCCFLANVREVSEQPNGLEHLQEKLISGLLMRNVVKVSSTDEGIEMIRERLCQKKVLIVLDDTDTLSQIDALAGHRDWFGLGSIIIITTRDQHLLNQVQVDGRYEAKELNYEESLELFSWHSFKKRFPEEPFAVTADKMISYSCGLPLALEVLGEFLFGRTIKQWKSALGELKKNPRPKIQKILQISYDGLDYQQKEIFLDIACFFIGMEIDYVTEILNGCGFGTEIGIRVLKDRCLLTMNRNNELRMHDLLRDMGREIIWQSFPKEPGKRSRLWSHEDVTDVVMRNMGTKAIEGVSLVSPIKEEIHLNTKNLEGMLNLRLLQMNNVNFSGSFNHLFKKIRWISWQGCSLEHLPSSLEMENLVALEMQHNKLTSIWQGNTVKNKRLLANKFSSMSRLWQGNQIQFPRHLKILNLSHSKCLTSSPDFTRVPSLVTLILKGCSSLIQIHPSIGCLDSLLVLDMEGCEKITNIPNEICSLRSLGYLNLNGCSNLKEFPENLGYIISLRELYADETPITKLPSSSIHLRYLTSLSLRGCTKISAKANISSIGVVSCLVGAPYKAMRRLNLRDCNLSDEDIPENIDWYTELRELDLGGNSFSKLPLSFGMLKDLESLWLDNWNILQSIPDLPPNLEALIAKNMR